MKNLLPLFALVLATTAAKLGPLDQKQVTPHNFGWGVNSPQTGDEKEHRQTVSSSGSTEGEYRWLQPNGLYRVTRYTADDINGYRAVVSEEPGEGISNYHFNDLPNSLPALRQSHIFQHSQVNERPSGNQEDIQRNINTVSDRTYGNERITHQNTALSTSRTPGSSARPSTFLQNHFDPNTQSSTLFQQNRRFGQVPRHFEGTIIDGGVIDGGIINGGIIDGGIIDGGFINKGEFFDRTSSPRVGGFTIRRQSNSRPAHSFPTASGFKFNNRKNLESIQSRLPALASSAVNPGVTTIVRANRRKFVF